MLLRLLKFKNILMFKKHETSCRFFSACLLAGDLVITLLDWPSYSEPFQQRLRFSTALEVEEAESAILATSVRVRAYGPH